MCWPLPAPREATLRVGVGVASSLPFVAWGGGVLSNLMNRHAWIIWLGGGILGYVAAEMMLEDPAVSARLGPLAQALEHIAPLALGAIVTGLGWLLARRHTSRAGGHARG